MRRILNESIYRFKNDGSLNAGGTVTFKLAGTATDKDAFNEYALTTALSNPLTLDSNGRSDSGSGEVWMEAGSYDVTVKDSGGSTINSLSDITDDVLVATSGADGFDINGSFESLTNDVPDNWTLSVYDGSGGTIAIDTTSPGDGTSALKFSSSGAGAGTATSIFLAIPQDVRTFELSWMMISSVADVKNDVDILWYDKSKTQLTGGDASTSGYSDAAANPTSWTDKKASFTPPSTAYWAKIQLTGCHSSDATTGNTHYDNVVMRIRPLQAADFPGALERPNFAWASITTITISAGMYNHNGTTEQLLYWDADLTFTVGSGGSNSDSSAIDQNAIQYLYIDDSAVVTLDSSNLTAAEFLSSTTAPTWSESKHGWYNGSDRCIFSLDTSDAGTGEVVYFAHNGDFVSYNEITTDLAATDIDTTWTDLALTLPSFSTMALAYAYVSVAAGTFYWRTNGAVSNGSQFVSYASTTGNSTIVITDSSQIIEVKEGASDTAELTVSTHGWFFPRGM